MAQCKVMVIDHRHLGDLLRGAARVRNLPKDGDIVATHALGSGLAVRVHSASYPAVPEGQPLPRVTAVIERSA